MKILINAIHSAEFWIAAYLTFAYLETGFLIYTQVAQFLSQQMGVPVSIVKEMFKGGSPQHKKLKEKLLKPGPIILIVVVYILLAPVFLIPMLISAQRLRKKTKTKTETITPDEADTTTEFGPPTD